MARELQRDNPVQNGRSIGLVILLADHGQVVTALTSLNCASLTMMWYLETFGIQLTQEILKLSLDLPSGVNAGDTSCRKM